MQSEQSPRRQWASSTLLFGLKELMQRLGTVRECEVFVGSRAAPDTEIGGAIVNDDADAAGGGKFVGGGLKKRDVHAAARD